MGATTGSFTGTGNGGVFSPLPHSSFNFTLTGTFVGTVAVERSFDDEVTWVPLTYGGTPVTFTAPCSEIMEEPEEGVKYRARCTAYTSGTINYRLSKSI